MPYDNFQHRLHAAERLAASEEIGPSQELKDLSAEIRRRPALRKLAAYHDLHQLSEEQTSELSPEDRAVLERYLALL
jgi:hypothetical protein